MREKQGELQSLVSKPAEQFENTDLARLCHYYLACLGFQEESVSVPLKSESGEPDYFKLPSIPRTPDDLADSDGARKLLGRKRTERGRYRLYFGYPVHIATKKSHAQSRYMVEPIFLFPFEQETGTGQLTVDLNFPIINREPFQRFTNVEPDMLMNELMQMKQELGLAREKRPPNVDEIATRLRSIRPDWPWKEDIDPSGKLPTDKIKNVGIYNRAVVLMAEKPPFTQGLEEELRTLARITARKYAPTALGQWLSDNPMKAGRSETTPPPLLEVLPMNQEQREAVYAALTRPITIITGPPGTGKSQVVTNLLVNAAWSGKRTLFASRNNKAVDVVETRINALGSRPTLLRMGQQNHQVRLAEYILELMSATTTGSEKEEFADIKSIHERLHARHDKLTEETQKLINLRKETDRLEQAAEDARENLGPELFKQALEFNANAIEKPLKIVSSGLRKADKNLAGTISKLVWPITRRRRFKNVAILLQEAQASFAATNCSPPTLPMHDADIPTIQDTVEKALSNLGELRKAIRYFKALKELQSLRPEEIAHEEAKVLQKLARHSEQLWKIWLRLRPSELSASKRKKLGKYTSLLKMVLETGKDGKLSLQIFDKYNEMLRDISGLFSCWAVTSLSAQGRIPFEPGHFDLVVFDEASQCDIASALPLLYRAKSVVVIGDIKQLPHISGLPRGQDMVLLERHGLLEKNFEDWAYSYQSLFTLGSTRAKSEDIVNLVDHHRSHADIIGFSNKEFYEERLRVATNYKNLRFPNRSEPGIRWIDVKGKAVRPGRGGAINMKEVDAVVAALCDLVIDKGYEGTVGVVTPFRAQANAIREAIHNKNQLASILTQRNFLVDTVHTFQGDECDVMVFSPVVSANFPRGALGFLQSNPNLFNVAITRARAQLIVTGNLAACRSCNIGYLSSFATYVTSLESQTKQNAKVRRTELGSTYPKVAKPELVSDWERKFYTAAYKTGLRLIPQYNIEKYIVDFLMVESERKLAIEIDGELYHRNWTGERCRRDKIRDQRLIELGYDVMRFWVYEVRDDMDGCLKRLENWQRSR